MLWKTSPAFGERKCGLRTVQTTSAGLREHRVSMGLKEHRVQTTSIGLREHKIQHKVKDLEVHNR